MKKEPNEVTSAHLPRTEEPREEVTAPEESAPIFGKWWIWYLIVLLNLILCIAFFYWLTVTFNQ